MEDADGHHPAGAGPDVFRPHAHGRVPQADLGPGLRRRRPPARHRAGAGALAHRRDRDRRPAAAQALLGQPGLGGALHLLLPGPYPHHRPAAADPRGQASTRPTRCSCDYTPFPASVCGTICPNLCMQNCSRQKVDYSIDVSILGRAVQTAEPPSGHACLPARRSRSSAAAPAAWRWPGTWP